VIALAAHIRQLGIKEAALALNEHFNVLAAPKPASSTKGLHGPRNPQEAAQRAEPDHEAVQALGIPGDVARTLWSGLGAAGNHGQARARGPARA
jgi:hypothetical protein